MPRYINADALNEAIEKWFDGVCVYDVSPDEAVNDYQSIVDEQPTVSPDEVRGVGEWIWHDKYGWDDSIECSCCAEEFVVYDGEFPGIDSFKFCPNCGARMKGAEDGTTE